MIILPYDVWVINVINRVHLNHIVLVYKVIECLRSHDDGANHLASVQSLLSSGHIPRLEHMHHTIGEHLRMYP